MLAKCVPTILELNGNKCFSCKNTKLNICHHMLTSTTQLQNRSFHVVERASAKCPKMKNARTKRGKLLFFIVKYANLWGSCCRRRRGCLSSLFLLLRVKITREIIVPRKALRNFGQWQFEIFEFSLNHECILTSKGTPSGYLICNSLGKNPSIMSCIHCFKKERTNTIFALSFYL